MDDVVGDIIDELRSLADEAASGIRGFAEMTGFDALQLVIIAAVAVLGIGIAIRVANKVIRILVTVAALVIVCFMLFGFDPMGLGSVLTERIQSLWAFVTRR